MIKPVARLSSDSQKKVEERRQQLKRSIEEKGGIWDEKWVVDGVPRAAGVNSGRLDMYYISPDGKRMRSMSEVYQFLGLTAAAPKSTRPAMSPQLVDAPRSSREAKIFATAAISASVANPYPVQSSVVGLPVKRPRLATSLTGPEEVRSYLDMEVRLAVEDPERWKALTFPVDARSRASVEAYEVSLRQSCAAEWRRNHCTSVRTLADRMSSQLKEAQQGIQAQAVKLDQHLKFLDESVFPFMTELLAACEAAGVPTAEAKEAAAKMQSRHKDFAEAAQRETVEAATTQTRLTEEITRISTDIEEKSGKPAVPLQPRPPTAEAHAAAAAAAAAAAVPADARHMPVSTVGALSSAAAAASIATRAGRRPTPAIGSAAARVNEAAARAQAGNAARASSPGAPTAAGVMRAQGPQQHTTLSAANSALPPMPGNSFPQADAGGPVKAQPSPTAKPASRPNQSNGARAPTAAPGSAKLNEGTVQGHPSFAQAPEVTLLAPRGHTVGRLGNPHVRAREDGSLWTADGKQIPVSEAYHYLFSAKGVAGKFSGKNVPQVKPESPAKPTRMTDEQRTEALMTAGRRLIWSACVAEKQARQTAWANSQNAPTVRTVNSSKPVGTVPMQQ